MNLPEELRMPEFDYDFENPVSERQLRMMLSNCMSLNVLERIFCSLLTAVGLSGPLLDVIREDAASHWGRRS